MSLHFFEFLIISLYTAVSLAIFVSIHVTINFRVNIIVIILKKISLLHIIIQCIIIMMFVAITSITVITMTQIRPKENQQFRNPQRSYLQVHKGREGEMEERRGTRRTDKDKETETRSSHVKGSWEMEVGIKSPLLVSNCFVVSYLYMVLSLLYEEEPSGASTLVFPVSVISSLLLL